LVGAGRFERPTPCAQGIGTCRVRNFASFVSSCIGGTSSTAKIGLTQNPKMRQIESWEQRPDVVLWTKTERGSMPRKGHTEEQIVYALRQVEAGKKVSEIVREMGVSQQAFYSWKRKYAGLGLNELRELRQLRDENRKLKTLVADLTLDKHILQEVLSKKA
jgi:putative transposase